MTDTRFILWRKAYAGRKDRKCPQSRAGGIKIKISIITVAYNSEKTIGNAIESVLGQSIFRKNIVQDRDRLEYLVIDGASKDGTVQTAEGYRSAFEAAGVEYRILSEPDNGIYDAMNKGIRLATGDIIGILNSDDWYEPDALETVLHTFRTKACDLMFADIKMHRADGSTFIKKARLGRFETSRHWNHPTTFVKAQLYKQYPFRNLGIHDDYGFYLQMRKLGVSIVTVDKVLADFCMGGASNHKDLKAAGKRIRDRYLYCYRINGYSRWYLAECVAIEAAKLILG